MSNLCSCIICKKQYSSKGIHSHYHISHTEDGKQRHRRTSEIGSKRGGASTQQKLKDRYEQNPIFCRHCGTTLPFGDHHKIFCNSSCAAKHNNTKRPKKEPKLNQPMLTHINKPKLNQPMVTHINKSIDPYKVSKQLKPSGPYTKLFQCSCSHCSIKFINRTAKKYCSNCEHLYSHNHRAKYWFTFNVFHYPHLFDLSLITTYGVRDNKTNPNGITRDHRVSVNEAIRNNYDPYYIKHPINCELMFFNENNKKKTKSSITYEELIYQVDQYDQSIRCSNQLS
jgi:hypothetical protein